MHITELFRNHQPVMSFEVFPPKKNAPVSTIYDTLDQLTAHNPHFISVTYGAGGTGSNHTLDIAAHIQDYCGKVALPHLTCLTATEASIKAMLEKLQYQGITNILALRGDYPPNFTPNSKARYNYAIDLIREIKGHGNFCIGAATYPEGHIESDDENKDMLHLKDKVEAGASFLISQLFFDNNIFYRFQNNLKARQIKCHISAGIMPILSKRQIQKMIFMCGASLPAKVIKLLVKYEHDPVALRQQGIAYAAEQVADLIRHGVHGIHLYTMNQPQIAQEILQQVPQLQPAIY